MQLRQTAAHQYYPLGRVVCQEQAHGSTRPDRLCTNVHSGKCEDIFPPKGGTDISESLSKVAACEL